MNNFKTQKKLLTEKAMEVTPALKSQIMHYQASQVKAGNKISWAQAQAHVMEPLEKAAKEAAKLLRKAARDADRAKNPPKPREKTMTHNQFKKIMDAAKKDFAADFGHEEEWSMGDIAWDVAGSLMYDKEIEKYVRKDIARNMGIDPSQVKKDRIQEYIADWLA